MRIYVTRMSINSDEEDAKFYSKAYALISVLKQYGHEIVYISDKDFRNYDEIYTALSSCNCLLGFTDSCALSST